MTDIPPGPLPTPVVPGMSGLSVMARGGYATVYRATQESVGREVAIKVENRTLDNERDQARFLREARAAGRMSSHPHVVDLFDVGVTVDRHPYLIMELCDGSYAERMRAAPLGPAEARDLGVKIADALAHAHAAGVLHRDVKPANILHSHFNPAVLADFGLAVLGEMRDSSVTLEVLTPAYAPPEMFRHAAPSPAVDVYALCATLYAVMRGKPPRWHDERDPSLITLLEMFSHPIPDLPGVPPALCEVLRYGMANEPTARPTAEQLRDLLAGLPIDPALPAPISGAPSSGGPSGGFVPGRHTSSSGRSPAGVYVSGGYGPASPQVSAIPAPPGSPPAPGQAHVSGPPPTPGPPYGRPGSAHHGPPPGPPGSAPPMPPPDDATPTVHVRRRRRFLRWFLGGLGALALLAVGLTAAFLAAADRPDPTPAPSAVAGSATVLPTRLGGALPGCLVPLPAGGTCPDTAECYGPVTGTGHADQVPCEARHTWEAYALGVLPTDVSPTDRAEFTADRTVRRLCNRTTFRVVTGRLDADRWSLYVLPPTPEAVADGDRTFRCLAGQGPDRLEGATLTG